ncbi:MAG: ankyrin repeat domain-containing protein [candidate division Zixibacteria bacterium]|nr:ankyrin repeat domain-containing protein [candidate division Zixibacteria bacterium]
MYHADVLKILLGVAVLLLATVTMAAELDEAVRNGDVARVRALLQTEPTLLNEKNTEGLTPLNLAAFSGQVAVVEALLDIGADMNIGDNENSQPIHNAAVAGHIPVLELLLARGADIDSRDDNGMTPFLFSCSYRQLAAARFLLDKGADFRATNKNGFPALLYAVIGRNVELAQLLIDNKVDVNQKTIDQGITPLFSAASFGQDEIFRLLIDNGAKINIKNNDGETPLFWALNPFSIEEARLLIEKGADVNARSNFNQTPLHNVAGRGTVAIAQLLLDHGADINAANNNGWVPLTHACWSGPEMVRFLILNGAEVNPPEYKDPDSNCFFRPTTPLHLAARHSDLEVSKILLENGARLNVRNQEGETPLYLAASQGHTDITEYLLEKGAFVGCPENKMNRTELHNAVMNGNSAIVDMLLKKGADVSRVDVFGKTPLDYAFNAGFDKIGYKLLVAGADDAELKNLIDQPNYLARDVQQREAVIWHLGHSGWAVKTQNHLLVFDYWLNPEQPTPEQASLAGGYIVPAELRDFNVEVFVSHGHGDHYHDNIFNWRDSIPDINYILGFRPHGIEEEYTFIGPRDDRTVDDIKVHTLRSTDAGVAFLLEVDGLTIFHAGDHANGHVDLSGAYPVEIDYLAGLNKNIDIAFFGITGCSLGDPVSVKAGIFYAVDKLSPTVLLPMHGGNAFYRYKEFADEFALKNLTTQVVYPTCKGERFFFKNGRMVEGLTDEVQASADE